MQSQNVLEVIFMIPGDTIWKQSLKVISSLLMKLYNNLILFVIPKYRVIIKNPLILWRAYHYVY